jgi:hypothetical protein
MLARQSCSLWVFVATTSFAISCGNGKESSPSDTTGSGGVSAGSTSSSGQGAGTPSTTGVGGGAAASSSAGAGGSSGPGGSGSSSTGVGGNAASDNFDGPTLDPSWSIVNGKNFSYSVSGGSLHITPTTNTLWWMGDATGALVYKLVTGNFKLTTAVRARRASDASQPVGPTDYQFGGIMARDPGSAGQNYIFGVVGDRGETLQVETKSTTNDASQVQAENWPSGDAQLRLCRVGAMFHVLSRPIGGGSWAVASPFGPPYERPDLPATLQVGPIAYAWTDSPDLRASFEYVQYASAASEADCTAD